MKFESTFGTRDRKFISLYNWYNKYMLILCIIRIIFIYSNTFNKTDIISSFFIRMSISNHILYKNQNQKFENGNQFQYYDNCDKILEI